MRNRFVTMFALFLVMTLPLSVSAKKEAGRETLYIASDPVLEPLMQQVLKHMPEGKLRGEPRVSKVDAKKALKQFCMGSGDVYPDIVAAPREMDETERKRCRERAPDIIKIKIGYEALVLATGKQNPSSGLGVRQLYLALASDVPLTDNDVPGKVMPNPHRNWKSLGVDMPGKIQIYGPAADSSEEARVRHLAMEPGCRQWEWIAEMKYSQRNRRLYRAICYRIREDGAYVRVQGELDERIKRLRANGQALSFVPFNQWAKYSEGLKALAVGDIPPTLSAIDAGLYPMARSYYVYIKLSAVTGVPGAAFFLNALASEEALSEKGFLYKLGMTPLPDKARREQIKQASELTVMEFE